MVSFPRVKQILLYQVVQFELAMSKIKLHVCFHQIIYWRDGIPLSCSYPYSAAIQRYGGMKGGGRSGPIRDGIVPSPTPPHQELEHYPRPVPEFQLGKTKLFYLAVHEDKLPPA